MAMNEWKKCGGQISQKADICPHCGDVIKGPKPKFSLVDLIHKIGHFTELRIGACRDSPWPLSAECVSFATWHRY